MSSWFSGTSEVGPSHSHGKSSSRHHHRPSSPARSEKPQYAFVRPHSPKRSASPTGSTRSFFFSRPHTSSTSSYRRSPRRGFIRRIIDTIRRLLRDLYRYARDNPGKLFFAVVLPLITGGALTKMLGMVGMRLPASLAGLAGLGKAFGGGGGGGLGEVGDIVGKIAGGGVGGMGMGEVIGLAKMFM